ncbi:hypothetical protein [Flavobacterium sp.]|jgi:hypothetical protein|uniref:hypothetical protein n=1 Tax=Flavobacterium sp. TaxID=239 RepID=UPI0037BF65E0
MKLTTKNYTLIIILTIIAIITIKLGKYLLDFDNIIYKSFSSELSIKQIERFLFFQKKIELLNFILIPIIFMLKTSIISSVLSIGMFFNNNDNSFKKILNIVIKAEFIFLLMPILKIFWFYFFQTDYTLEDIQYFYPLSALNIIGYKELDSWLIYPLQTLNLFEVAYIIYLSYQIGDLTKTNADNGLKIVSYSYVPTLLLWVTVIMFFTLNYS